MCPNNGYNKIDREFFSWHRFLAVDKPTVNTTDEMNGPYCGGWSEACPLEEGQKNLNSKSVYTLFAIQLKLANRMVCFHCEKLLCSCFILFV